MDPNTYLNAIVFYRLAQRDQKQKAVPEPEFRRFDLTYLTGAPAKRNQSQDTAGTEKLLSTMQNSYADKIVLVTGIGKATAIAFPDACAKVVLTGLEPGSTR